jgi:hypothetical protein
MLLDFQAETEKRRLATTKTKEPVTHIEKPLEENINRLQTEGVQARSVEEAIAVLRYLAHHFELIWFAYIHIFIYFFIYLVSSICL